MLTCEERICLGLESGLWHCTQNALDTGLVAFHALLRIIMNRSHVNRRTALWYVIRGCLRRCGDWHSIFVHWIQWISVAGYWLIWFAGQIFAWNPTESIVLVQLSSNLLEGYTGLPWRGWPHVPKQKRRKGGRSSRAHHSLTSRESHKFEYGLAPLTKKLRM